MTRLFGAVAAIMLGLAVLAPRAEAHCWWNGYRWHCARYYRHYVRYPHRYYYGYGYYPYYYRPYYYGPYYRPYACVFPFCW